MLSVNTHYRKNFTVLKDFEQAGFTGLNRDVIKPLEAALEQTKNIHRYLNDKYVDTKTYEYPSLYQHIYNGLVMAKNDIFDKAQKMTEDMRKLATEFNKAFLVHDFGEMLMEFSTVAGRHSEQENGTNDKDKRNQIERAMAKLVFNVIQLFKPKAFISFFSERAKKITETSKYSEKINLAERFIKDGRDMVAMLKKGLPDTFKSIREFTDEWMRLYNLSQTKISLKDNFIGNLVKVVDKLEGVDMGNQIQKAKIPANFRLNLIGGYMKAYKGLKECTETKAAQKGDAKEQVFGFVDKLVRQQFKKDNKRLSKKHHFKGNEQEAFQKAYELTPSLAA